MAKATKKTTKKASVKPSKEKAEAKPVRKIQKKRESWTQERRKNEEESLECDIL